MERKYKRSHKVYTAWNYQKEIEDLNRESEEGWQLIKGGCFSSKFKRMEGIRYRYQLDYAANIEDKGRYIESFRDDGWEYINSTFNGWHYFRKVYDPSLSEMQYEIYTDRASLKEMNERWANLAMSVTAIVAIFTLIQIIRCLFMPMLPTLIQILAMAAILVLFVRGILIMKNPEKEKNTSWDSALFAVLFVVMIAGCFGSILLNGQRPHFSGVFAGDDIEKIAADLSEALEWNTIEIAYTDNYYLDLNVTAIAPVCFSILDESGEVVYTAEGSAVDETDTKVHLKKGIYTLYFSNFEGGLLNVACSIE